ncbi:hypothetical protein BDR04DRAFT_1091067 [Suillus decipiens]|nr:hypothetical protein BDR04DRAFT_1091067 [Suillus decipiens]
MKTGMHCKNKWNTLKASYNQINKYLLKLGIHWDPVCGANIQGAAAEEAWSNYVSNPMLA